MICSDAMFAPQLHLKSMATSALVSTAVVVSSVEVLYPVPLSMICDERLLAFLTANQKQALTEVVTVGPVIQLPPQSTRKVLTLAELVYFQSCSMTILPFRFIVPPG